MLAVVLLLVVVPVLAGCGSEEAAAQSLPTLMQLPTLTATDAAVMMAARPQPTDAEQGTPAAANTQSRRPTLPPSWTPTPSPTVTAMATATQTPTITASATHTPAPTVTPKGRAAISDQAVALFRRNITRGSDPRVFAKVGDCITDLHPFLIGFDRGEYDLGEYTHLQSTIDHFSGSFARPSISSGNNFSTATVLDPLWATDERCLPGETPIECEYRVNKPSIAVVMLGTNDVRRLSLEEYRLYLTRIIEITIDYDVLPVLATFPTLSNYYPAQSVAFNGVIIALAGEFDIPLIDLRAAMVDLPNRGMQEDGLHPSNRGDSFIDLTGEQFEYGMTMRNLMTLQMLDSIITASRLPG